MTAHLLKGMATPQRLRWLFTDHPIYFITACTYNRRQILAQPAVHNSFIEFAFRACEYRVWVGHYVIMPDHIHLFAGFGPESITLSAWMKSLKNAISKILKNATFHGPHWRKAFSIMSFDPRSLMTRSGSMFGTILCAPG